MGRPLESGLGVLILADPAQRSAAWAIARALGRTHATAVVEAEGLRGALEAARAAFELGPALVHAVGLVGRGPTARAIAAGVKAPLVVSLGAEEVEGSRRAALLGVARAADALLVDEGRAADVLRRLGIQRDIYVVAPPPSPADDGRALEALEVVYRRLLSGVEPGRRDYA